MASAPHVTQLLIEWSKGTEASLDRLMPLVYSELHSMAARYTVRWDPGHTLQATALINEVYMRLKGASGKQWENQAHFFGVAAMAMRHVLVDYARARNSAKRGGRWGTVPLDEAVVISRDRLDEIVALDDALSELEKLEPRQCKVVELRYFGGLSVEETAQQLRVSPDTVARDWRTARAWLYGKISRRILNERGR